MNLIEITELPLSHFFWVLAGVIVLAIGLHSGFVYGYSRKKNVRLVFWAVMIIFITEVPNLFFYLNSLGRKQIAYLQYYAVIFVFLKYCAAVGSSYAVLRIFHPFRKFQYIFIVGGVLLVPGILAWVTAGAATALIFFKLITIIIFAATALQCILVDPLEVEDKEFLIVFRYSAVLSFIFMAVGTGFYISYNPDQGVLTREHVRMVNGMQLIALIILDIAYFFLLRLVTNVLHVENITYESQINDLKREKSIYTKLNHSINQQAVQTEQLQHILQPVSDTVKSTVRAIGSIIWLKNNDTGEFNAIAVSGDYVPLHPVQNYILEKRERVVNKLFSDTFKAGETYAGQVARTQRPLYKKNLLKYPDPEIKQNLPGVVDIKSVITIPIIVKDEVIGIISAINKNTVTGNFNDADLSMVALLGDQVGIACTQFALTQEHLSKKMEEKDVALAGDIQQGLLPAEFNTGPRLDFYGYSLAAKGVGGDYYDYYRFDDKHYGIIMSDVAGKGVPASLVMVILRSTFRATAAPGVEPDKILESLNSSTAGEVSQERYATCFYYTFDAEKMQIKYANAAHGPLFFYHAAADSFEELDADGMPLGIVKESQYQAKSIAVEQNDILVLYTDGVTEAMNADRNQYSAERLKEQIKKNKDFSAKKITENIHTDIDKFVAGAPQHDDQTLFVVKIL
ncbi:MAG TPA: GAF domain-containing SpoIIE family protein phosphatase [Spirochaetota bacterium]|nr:GAF domain-containing SpoIIE family protein phosphatase [Spirochaetota bacterium]